MAETTKTRRRAAAARARAGDRDFVSRLADAGEEALNRLADLPGGQRALNAMNDLRTRVDELAKRVRGIEKLEERVAKLEKDVASLKKARSGSTRSTRTRQASS